MKYNLCMTITCNKYQCKNFFVEIWLARDGSQCLVKCHINWCSLDGQRYAHSQKLLGLSEEVDNPLMCDCSTTNMAPPL